MPNKNNIYVTRPLQPDFEELTSLLKEVYDSKWLTNMGPKHNLLEENIKEELKVNGCSLVNNATSALLMALKICDLPQGSEVITTPFTFAATTHAISWNGLKPVFCDIEPDTMTIDANKIESLITPNTSAILGVHVYGFPCNVEKIEALAKKYNLKVIYDAAHAFSTEINGKGIGTYGDISVFSFHSTKLFNTIEGGCLTSNNHEYIKISNLLRDFGILDENTISCIGINAKLNELQSAWGLLNLKIYKNEQLKRSKIKNFYDEHLSKIKGIKIPKMPCGVKNSYQYYPIIIDEDFQYSRDELCKIFNTRGIFPRKYFSPICSDFACYRNAKKSDLSIVNSLKNKIMCLPFWGDLTKDDLNRIMNVFVGG